MMVLFKEMDIGMNEILQKFEEAINSFRKKKVAPFDIGIKVSKGVLKENLILLANSMTYAGNLIDFNSGGYKALTQSLNVQVPFTEATLIVRNWNFV
ncbi:DNA-directed RNA polymerase V subunit 1-like [Morus notabilis]|uniref:DNA-directed RNA polymerase V subunit 1-like n=1 Tax=Morus notabilis TaxID=981085 RepID=UPI000CED7BDF|nr:DNA-directed RNA polymerase V subunit 1-like [Morus notabilis]